MGEGRRVSQGRQKWQNTTGEVITDRETGYPCGFGFVEMPERSAARAAIAGLHGMDFGGHACMVNEAYWWVRDYETS
jgi:RNA recognition motif. (a.k.a. RRM, RBD, or RNP domain)